MTIEDRARASATRDDFIAFLECLRAEYQQNRSTWSNRDLGSFLDALAAWARDADGYYRNAGEAPDALSPWRVAAEAMLAARTYE